MNGSVDYIIAEIRATARRWHQEQQMSPIFRQKTLQAKHLRAAVTRAMDLADGEAEWATDKALTSVLLAKTRAQYRAIRLGYCRSVGGYTHKRGDPQYYAIEIQEGVPYVTVSGHAPITDGD